MHLILYNSIFFTQGLATAQDAEDEADVESEDEVINEQADAPTDGEAAVISSPCSSYSEFFLYAPMLFFSNLKVFDCHNSSFMFR